MVTMEIGNWPTYPRVNPAAREIFSKSGTAPRNRFSVRSRPMNAPGAWPLNSESPTYSAAGNSQINIVLMLLHILCFWWSCQWPRIRSTDWDRVTWRAERGTVKKMSAMTYHPCRHVWPGPCARCWEREVHWLWRPDQTRRPAGTPLAGSADRTTQSHRCHRPSVHCTGLDLQSFTHWDHSQW